ncbi:ADP-ribosylglycohydrolase family protein [Salinicola sp. DM10]|uniref:ADP-ribosylglycohydrolase family protein n=1 Tax=Salinicola sp. DM10 TaxID=2815721 RepID=UPI001A8DD5A1|nr:ADP-ribosylglycohydrolase family protein [Salinicola sp. DM10]MCE3026712.1 ADP-ribosylglycohydrolase family protein [Salinicola sp. DM10]
MNIDRNKSMSGAEDWKAYERSVINSALWAAAGDALGWITELAFSRSKVKARSGQSEVRRPISWNRMIGGRNGPKVYFPAGTYSDDTQLRLAVSRSIRGDGVFDAESFAKVEVTVWPNYALGGGKGTKAAALNLSRRGVNWFSNFFESGGQNYIHGGGNGAAMRIQPHVWSSNGNRVDLILNVLKDSLVTHGHPHGFCGAVFHALALHSTIKEGRVPDIKEWYGYADSFSEILEAVSLEPRLSSFWQPAWEEKVGISLKEALVRTCYEAKSDIDRLSVLIKDLSANSYRDVLEELGCLTSEYRGSGLKTALAALALSYIYREGDIEEALGVSSNELESDTDTIATMAGAILGVGAENPPEWDIQDKEYIVCEARRLSAVAMGEVSQSFPYPDLGYWDPPCSQVEAVAWTDSGMAISGLGHLSRYGEEYKSGSAIWQWCKLPYGQTILAKRKVGLKESLPVSQLPDFHSVESKPVSSAADVNREDFFVQSRLPIDSNADDNELTKKPQSERDFIDIATDEIISSGFDDVTIGKFINQCIDCDGSIVKAVSLVAIVAKAKLARKRRGK